MWENKSLLTQTQMRDRNQEPGRWRNQEELLPLQRQGGAEPSRVQELEPDRVLKALLMDGCPQPTTALCVSRPLPQRGGGPSPPHQDWVWVFCWSLLHLEPSLVKPEQSSQRFPQAPSGTGASGGSSVSPLLGGASVKKQDICVKADCADPPDPPFVCLVVLTCQLAAWNLQEDAWRRRRSRKAPPSG